MERDIVILGAGGHARVVADACLEAGRGLRGFLAREVASRPLPAPLLGDDELLSSPTLEDCEFLIGIGSEVLRAECGERVRACGHSLATVVHPRAIVARDVGLADGVVVFAGAVINSGAVLGPLAVVNTAATIDHDSTLAECAQVGPGARIAGEVSIGAQAFIGSGGGSNAGEIRAP